MEKMTLGQYVLHVLEKQKIKFAGKNMEYGLSKDELSNFTTGAMLMYHDNSIEFKYETLKDYLAKHVAKIYDHGIACDTDDSWEDLMIYAAIALYMRDVYKQEQD